MTSPKTCTLSLCSHAAAHRRIARLALALCRRIAVVWASAPALNENCHRSLCQVHERINQCSAFVKFEYRAVVRPQGAKNFQAQFRQKPYRCHICPTSSGQICILYSTISPSANAIIETLLISAVHHGRRACKPCNRRSLPGFLAHRASQSSTLFSPAHIQSMPTTAAGHAKHRLWRGSRQRRGPAVRTARLCHAPCPRGGHPCRCVCCRMRGSNRPAQRPGRAGPLRGPSSCRVLRDPTTHSSLA